VTNRRAPSRAGGRPGGACRAASKPHPHKNRPPHQERPSPATHSPSVPHPTDTTRRLRVTPAPPRTATGRGCKPLLAARAQQARKLPTIGFLVAGTPSTYSHLFAALVERLRELGWMEGRNVAIEYRWEGVRRISCSLKAPRLRQAEMSWNPDWTVAPGDGREKSDSAIVAGKPTNKAVSTAAEPVERRAEAKGNASQQSTRRTQSRVSVSHALERIREA
jgi:hypothetical protein